MLRNKRWFLIASLMMVVALIAGACGAPAAPPPPADTPAPGETPAPTTPPEATPAPPEPTAREIKNPDAMIMATAGEPDSMDPSYEYDTASYEIIYNVYETLVWWERENYDVVTRDSA